MNDVINNLYWEAERALKRMKKSNMSLSDRVDFEVALAKLDALHKITRKYTLNP